MNVNINHPSFISFLENVSASILSNVTISNYFSLNQDKKLSNLKNAEENLKQFEIETGIKSLTDALDIYNIDLQKIRNNNGHHFEIECFITIIS